jgi:RES domain-containing protein
MDKPFRLLKFRDLPEIPICKRYVEGRMATPEAEIYMKIHRKEVLTNEEEKLVKECIEFYKNVIPLLRKVDFNSLSKDDLQNLKGYFNYIFNYILICQNDMTCYGTRRVVKNKDVLGIERSLPNVSFLKYPPLEKVKEIGKYNRANTPNFNMFYGATSVNAALMETKPEKNELITAGIWYNPDLKRTLNTYTINFGKSAIEANPLVKKGYDYFQRIKEINHPLLMEVHEIIYEFLGEEYSKPANNHLDYFYSATYTEKILSDRKNKECSEAIMYASIQNKYKYENLAIIPEIFDERFVLVKIYEMVVNETYYDKEIDFDNLDEISYIKPYYIREPRQVLPDGKIIW